MFCIARDCMRLLRAFTTLCAMERRKSYPRLFREQAEKEAIVTHFHFRDKWKSGTFPILPFPPEDGNRQG